MSEERLQRILARAGLGSRRSCERLISGGHVSVDGRLITELGASADVLTSTIRVDGQAIQPERLRYVLLNKPAGYLSNPDQRAEHPSWMDLVSVPERLFPVGRLDLDSEGLMLLTNDGELAQHLAHPRFEHSKTYLVEVVGVPDPRKLRRLRHGIMLDDGPTAPAEVTLLRDAPQQISLRSSPVKASRIGGRAPRRSSWLRILLREGRKRQLRRMVARLGHPALRVVRIGMGPLELGQLPAGKWRELWPAEVEALRAAADLGRVASAGSPAATAVSQGGRRVRRSSAAVRDRGSKSASPQAPRIIAVDGPSASGKSSVGRLLARHLGYLYFDTGVMYRAVAQAALERGIRPTDETAVTALARRLVLEVLPPTISDGRDVTVKADGVDITWEIRSREVELAVSPISAFAGVREAMRLAQRRVGLVGGVVMVGRDIGSVVLPEADLKVYLDAPLKVRASRRYVERRLRGESPSLDDVLADMKTRDQIDSTRLHAPLIVAADAIVIDTGDLTIDQVLERILGLLEKKAGSHG